jgi:flavodoxin II|tara:strand:+ start:226 stop:753 length:528 start_codon:yes stop_codon:yes gene_type:complete
MQIGLFYGSTTCYTEMAAEKIQNKLNDLFDMPVVEVFNIKDVGLDKVSDYDFLIFGISTWDFGELQEDWESQWSDLENLDLSGKTLACFGMGDQEGYAEWFQDALGMLHDVALASGAKPIGYWPNSDDYEFEASKALTQDESHFVGLALDDEGQYDKTDERINTWCEQLIDEMAE